jgi:hypothetical protein
MLTWNVKKIVDFKTACLHGNHKGAMFMKILRGMYVNENV